MNRKWTDFSQPNMSYLPGVLDSTRFTYMHPGMHGDLPALWLPVQCTRRRDELRSTMRQRLKGALSAIEAALEDNIIGGRVAHRLSEKHREVRRLVRDSRQHLSPFSSRQSAARSSTDHPSAAPRPADSGSSVVEIADDATSLASSAAAAERLPPQLPATMTQLEVQQKMDDIHVEAKCSALGIDSSVVRNWDPVGLHRSITYTQITDDAPPPPLPSDSESEYDDQDSRDPTPPDVPKAHS
ncbi:hypothetical protein IWQ56_004767 [Coemansia nantahalensis]|nr:hypothetical protein IWQ56_004767 [Coemansia nantahalensis]